MPDFTPDQIEFLHEVLSDRITGCMEMHRGFKLERFRDGANSALISAAQCKLELQIGKCEEIISLLLK